MQPIGALGWFDEWGDIDTWLFFDDELGDYVLEVIEDEKCVQVERWNTEGAARARMLAIVESRRGSYIS